jgi:hypothetical protein
MPLLRVRSLSLYEVVVKKGNSLMVGIMLFLEICVYVCAFIRLVDFMGYLWTVQQCRVEFRIDMVIKINSVVIYLI